MAVTINDVARVAGVGVGTVSRVLNNSQAVKDSTRERVLAAIAKLNYTPDPIARSMIVRRTGSLGVIIPFFTRPFAIEILRGVEEAVGRLDYELIIYSVANNEQRDHYFNRLPMRRRVDGLLIVALNPVNSVAEGFKEAGIPAVLVDAHSAMLTSLMVKNVEGAYHATKYLIGLGHRRIGFVNGTMEDKFDFNQAEDRFAGLKKAHAEAQIEFDPDLAVIEEWDRPGGQAAGRKLLNCKDRPTAIFAASDIQALGVMETARSMGITIPDELSIMGFDDIELAGLIGLTTIRQPMSKMGKIGISKLMEHIENPAKEPELFLFDTTLIERGSTAPLKKAVTTGD